MEKKISGAAQFIRDKNELSFSTALILGSGLGFLADCIKDPVIINYCDIPGFKQSTVKGHAGRLVCGRLNNHPVIVMQGRYHYYEGHPMSDITFPVRVFGGLGIKNLIVTNAAGGINPFLETGDLMLIRDHINMGPNPLLGVNLDNRPRFLPLDDLYSPKLRRIAKKIAEQEGIRHSEGVYLFTSGPSYETKAEIRMFYQLGADAVGMSTVPETITARHSGISDILAISLITNKTLGNFVPTHEEVVETGRKSRKYFANMIMRLLTELDQNRAVQK